jgi:hypothetical protein
MRFSVLHVKSVGQWAVVDSKAGDFIVAFYDSEARAREAARTEEARWDRLVAEAIAADAA